jgi:hypothetical protein
MYFTSRDTAERCAAELAALDFLCGTDEAEHSTPEEHAEFAAECLRNGACDEKTYQALMEQVHSSPLDEYDWLLRAAHECELGPCHYRVADIVERHGGFYDSGESGAIDIKTGQPIRQADAR